MKIAAEAGSQQLEVTIERDNGHYVVTVGDERHVCDVLPLEGNFLSILTGGRSYEVSVEVRGDGYLVRHGAAERLVTLTDPGRRARAGMHGTEGAQPITAAMPGKVVRLLVAEGDEVAAGQGLMVLEAMKMENEITSPKAGTVRSIEVAEGEAVEGGSTLAVVE